MTFKNRVIFKYYFSFFTILNDHKNLPLIVSSYFHTLVHQPHNSRVRSKFSLLTHWILKKMWKCLRIVKMHFSEMCWKFAITFHWLTITTCYYQRNHVHILISHFENFTQIFCQLWLVEQIFYENFYGFDKLLKVLHKLQVSSQIKVLITFFFEMPKRNLNVKSSVIFENFSNFWTSRFSWFTLFKYCHIHAYFVIRISKSGFLIQHWVWEFR